MAGKKKKTFFQTLHYEMKINFWLTQAVPQNLLAIIPVILEIALSFPQAIFGCQVNGVQNHASVVHMHVCTCVSVSLCLIE